MTALEAPASLVSGRRKSPGEYIWPIATFAVVIILFFFYKQLLPNLDSGTRQSVQNWLSISALNEMVIYVIMALGLNVVVGYAGLLDLGYVAFWGIGTYVAAELMSG